MIYCFIFLFPTMQTFHYESRGSVVMCEGGVPPNKTKLRQGVDSTPTRGRFNFDKTRFSPERQNAQLLWSPARFSLLLVNKKRKKLARDNSKLKLLFSNWREFNPPAVADGKGISIRIRPPFCRGQFLPLLSNAAPNKILLSLIFAYFYLLIASPLFFAFIAKVFGLWVVSRKSCIVTTTVEQL